MTDVRAAASLVILLQEEEASEADEIAREVRREFPDVTMLDVLREVSALDQTRGEA